MKQLNLSLMGAFRANLGDKPLVRFRTQKLQALLIYLAVERERTHRRETVMGLLWPDLPQKSARDTLRQTLSLIRKLIPTQIIGKGEEIPFIISDRNIIQVHPSFPINVDVKRFLDLSKSEKGEEHLERLQEAAHLIQGEFLSDFYLSDSSAFEGWASRWRSRVHQTSMETMQALTAVYLTNHQYGQAEHMARRQLEFDDLDENAHRQLMTALALNGRRPDALIQYDKLHKLLWEQLEIAPDLTTQQLLEAIEQGTLRPPQEKVTQLDELPQLTEPIFLHSTALTPASEHSKFVARKEELKRLNSSLKQTLQGKGKVMFITGEAGFGKSALLQAFMKQAIEQNSTLLAVDGTCYDIAPVSGQLQPIRQWLSMLAGDLESKWGLGSISGKWARRLWQVAPKFKEIVESKAPNAIGSLVSETLFPNFESNSEEKVEEAMLGDITAVLQTLSQTNPLILVVDDLQWVDDRTANFLFQLGKQIANYPILLICAYRPTDIALNSSAQTVIRELEQVYGKTAVSLENANHHTFSKAFLDSQPNHLQDAFKDQFFNQTNGHPLFSVELFKDLQQKGQLILNKQIKWIEATKIDWSIMPSKVEATIAKRINRLDERQLNFLKTAAVEGQQFTAELIAHIHNLSPIEIVQIFSGQLDQQHRLIEVVGIERIGVQRFSRYQFRNHLLYQYLQTQLDPVEKVYLHEVVGDALAYLVGDSSKDFGSQLAFHYEQAGLLEKAATFLPSD